MRRALTLAAGITATLVTMPAVASGLCDPDGHFCMDVDTTGAVPCDLLRPDGLDPQTCTREDLALRDQLRAAQWPIFGARLLRFDGWHVLVDVAKRPATPELSSEEVDVHANRVRAMLEANRKVDLFAPPQVSRVRGVQTIRLDAVWTEGDHRVEEVTMEVHTSAGVYGITFQGTPGPKLRAFADRVTATLDAAPASRANGWFVSACGIAGAAIAYTLVRLGLRKRRGIRARDLWPR